MRVHIHADEVQRNRPRPGGALAAGSRHRHRGDLADRHRGQFHRQPGKIKGVGTNLQPLQSVPGRCQEDRALIRRCRITHSRGQLDVSRIHLDHIIGFPIGEPADAGSPAIAVDHGSAVQQMVVSGESDGVTGRTMDRDSR